MIGDGMSLRVESLKNFTVLADTGNMTAAAASLHISQPALSRQVAALEREMGHALYRREAGIIRLTQEGRVLYDYAKSIAELADRARESMGTAKDEVAGSVYLGYGESGATPLLARAAKLTREQHPHVEFHLTSGDAGDLIESLNRGSLDFMVECGLRERSRYCVLDLPGRDTWVAIMGQGHPLANRAHIRATDLEGVNVVVARQAWAGAVLKGWAGDSYAKMEVVATVNVGTAAIELVQAGLGVAIGYAELIDRFETSSLVCIPLDPPIYDKRGLMWRKDRILSPASQAYLRQLESLIQDGRPGRGSPSIGVARGTARSNSS